ncbi:putative lysosomal cobalamin transporter,related protein [Toxoplasma gondii TgCatPRC2]|uniref:Putative lysosomal cobalamin transporter,related protein n=1 Tax=Toxoplasma gondii TgCatPRC2 TaxID=1130821 RepID=A0A151HL26_TOXGO|nr:putative lysosomal cobalamin transporter,related protein [Toxoplasma gondii TgCatPRC2]
MSLLLGGWVYAVTAGGLLLLSGSLYWFYVRRKASNLVAFMVFSATLATVFLLCLLVPLDILVASRPGKAEFPGVAVVFRKIELPSEGTSANFSAGIDKTEGETKASSSPPRRLTAAGVSTDSISSNETSRQSFSSRAKNSYPRSLFHLPDLSTGSTARRLATQGLPSSSPSASSTSLSSLSASEFKLSAAEVKEAARGPSFSFFYPDKSFSAEAGEAKAFESLMQRLQTGAAVQLPPLSLDALSLKQLYVSLFSLLLFLTYLALPFAFFYSRRLRSLKTEFGRGRSYEIDTSVVPPFTVACAAAQQTLIFVVLLLLFLSLCLTQRPSFRQPSSTSSPPYSSSPFLHASDQGRLDAAASVDYLLRYTAAVFDLDHSGADSLLFVVSALLAFGQLGWVVAGAYGLAALPALWLRGRMTPAQQQREVQREIAELREQQRQLQSKYVNAGGASLKEMSEKDRAKLLELQAQQQQFTQRTYRLQEEEHQQSTFFAVLCRGVLLPFRWVFGVLLFLFSLSVAGALFLALLQRLEFSRCTYSCGFVLDDDATAREGVLFNPLDELLVRLSQFFPADFLLVGAYFALLFLCLLYGFFSLRVRICKKTCEPVRAGRTPPESLLILCFLLVHFLLAASLALLSVAPRYASFGAQTFSPANGSDPIPCSLQATASGEETTCRMSFFAAVFSRASVAYPSFANFFFFSNWAFLGIYALCTLYCLLTRPKQPHLSDRWLEEEESEGSFNRHANPGFAMQDGNSSLFRASRKDEETLKLLATCDEDSV